MPAKKTSVFKEPAVVVAFIGLTGVLVTSLLAPLILKAVEKSAATETAAAKESLPYDAEYAAQLLAEVQTWQVVVLDSFDTNAFNWSLGDTILRDTVVKETVPSQMVSIPGESRQRWIVPTFGPCPTPRSCKIFILPWTVKTRNALRLSLVPYPFGITAWITVTILWCIQARGFLLITNGKEGKTLPCPTCKARSFCPTKRTAWLSLV